MKDENGLNHKDTKGTKDSQRGFVTSLCPLWLCGWPFDPANRQLTLPTTH